MKFSKSVCGCLAAGWAAAFLLAACVQPEDSYQTVIAEPPTPLFGGGAPLITAAIPIPATLTPSPDPALITPTPPTPTSAAACFYDATFVTDVTVPDYTTLRPGARFTKTWRLQNVGNCGWEEGFSLTFVEGNSMGTVTAVPIASTPVNGIADISIQLTAPPTAGNYIGVWQLSTPDGRLFGIKPFVLIVVQGTAASSNPPAGGTPAPPTATFAPAQPPPAVISGVTYTSRQVFLAGQTLGNRANVFAKVGDSITDEYYFLGPIGDGLTVLGDYGYLQPAINFFSSERARTGNSFNNDSFAAVGGWPAFAPLASSLSDPACAGQTPLACEVGAIRPSVALIMLGTNDILQHYTVEFFEGNLRNVVQASMDMGVIPVLYTLPDCVCGDVRPFNDGIIRTARGFDVPLIDYWSAMQAAPSHGLRSDGIHPSVPPHGNTADFTADGLQYGYDIRNLLTVQMLDTLWRQVLSY